MLSSNKEIGQVILFLSKYPQTPEEFRDGFYQRVENVDRFFIDDERIYLNISLLKNLKKKIAINTLRQEVSCNLFVHFLFIIGLFRKSSFIYIQSIYNALYSIIFILLIDNKYILDLHGVVPEELELQNKKFFSIIFSVIESLLFKKVNMCIAVTNCMVQYFRTKYPKSLTEYMVYAILPSHLKKYNLDVNNENQSKIQVIYSGNAQIWQNIDLMLNLIKNNISDKINYTILTGEPEIINQKLNAFNIGVDKVTVKSVKPEELETYYKSSHYGFILRDDIIVNQVACPTKIIEYLNYGIIPIVLSEKIGDFESYGYEYILLTEFNDSLSVRKSSKNIEIVRYLFDINNFNFRSKIFNV
ncbi:glycosyl transferase family 1 [Acinetobacter seifertii]|uniref:glycosyl transferase family 1 n=1 Tax=Acinetobacter seifertii TaxID=1530123 RepID=UPI0032B5B226